MSNIAFCLDIYISSKTTKLVIKSQTARFKRHTYLIVNSFAPTSDNTFQIAVLDKIIVCVHAHVEKHECTLILTLTMSQSPSPGSCYGAPQTIKRIRQSAIYSTSISYIPTLTTIIPVSSAQYWLILSYKNHQFPPTWH